jgi:hypothetical protein
MSDSAILHSSKSFLKHIHGSALVGAVRISLFRLGEKQLVWTPSRLHFSILAFRLQIPFL